MITADRPQEWVDQDDSQTIRQNGVFANIVKDSWQVPAELRGEEERWYANRLINEAINCALKGRRGPVHINVPLREPLYGQRIYPEETVRSVEFLESAPTLASEVWDSITERFQACRKVMVLAGFHLPDCRLKESLDKLAALNQVVVLSESPANLGSGRHIATIDMVLATVQEEEKADLAPDLLITFGGPLISRYVKAFLRQYKPAEHWSVDCSECPADTFKALTSHIHLEAADFFSALGEREGE